MANSDIGLLRDPSCGFSVRPWRLAEKPRNRALLERNLCGVKILHITRTFLGKRRPAFDFSLRLSGNLTGKAKKTYGGLGRAEVFGDEDDKALCKALFFCTSASTLASAASAFLIIKRLRLCATSLPANPFISKAP